MKSLKLVLIVSVIAMFTQACHKRENWGISGKGENISQVRDLAGFSRIHLSCDANVQYVQDSVYRVEITGQPNILNVLETTIEGAELVISYNRNVWEHRTVSVLVHSPEMKGMSLSGSGNIRSADEVRSDNINLSISGSGNISLSSLAAQRVEARISGSGNIDLDSGEADTGVFTISGSGNIHAEHLPTQTNTSKISGSGNIRVNAVKTLNVIISGSGDVYYKGSPTMDVEISGSGKLRHI